VKLILQGGSGRWWFGAQGDVNVIFVHEEIIIPKPSCEDDASNLRPSLANFAMFSIPLRHKDEPLTLYLDIISSK
jgi:hypothetical protein